MVHSVLVLALLLLCACSREPVSPPQAMHPPAQAQAVIPSAIDAAAPGAAQAVSAEDLKQAQEAAAENLHE